MKAGPGHSRAKGKRELTVDDLMHYQKMVVALGETERVMGEVDGINN